VTAVETEPPIAVSLAKIAAALEALAEVARYRYLPPSMQKENEREDEDA
jgi:hypothetical protein